MRRPLLAGIGLAAVLVVAACSTDEPSQVPLAPTVPSLASGPQCSGSGAADFYKAQKALFTGAALSDLQARFDVIKSLCPNAVPQMMDYLQAVVTWAAPTTNGARAQALVNHWSALVLYVKNETKTWPADVLKGDGALGGVQDGGAKLLAAGGSMTTFDGRAALQLGSPIPANGPFLFTFQPVAGSQCDGGTMLKTAGICYDVSDYPDGGTFNPAAVISLCVHQPYTSPFAAGIGHARQGFGTEVLPEVTAAISCAHDPSTAMNSWLGREAGPLGKALALAYDYLRPRALFADDAGESGSIGSFSLVGGVHSDIIRDDLDELNTIPGPDVGGSWTIEATSPGYIQINPTGLGDLPGPIVELSQAQGNCAACPTFRLLATRLDTLVTDTVGTYEVSWQSVQTKPSVKEAPFVVLNDAGAEIARLSYVTESSHNILRFTAGGVSTDVGNWVRNVSQAFKITVNLTTLNPATRNKVSFAFGPTPSTVVTVPTNPDVIPNATTVKRIGYILTGIDAGIIGADNFKVSRLQDIP
jgi:hypothetical protein